MSIDQMSWKSVIGMLVGIFALIVGGFALALPKANSEIAPDSEEGIARDCAFYYTNAISKEGMPETINGVLKILDKHPLSEDQETALRSVLKDKATYGKACKAAMEKDLTFCGEYVSEKRDSPRVWQKGGFSSEAECRAFVIKSEQYIFPYRVCMGSTDDRMLKLACSEVYSSLNSEAVKRFK